MKHFRSRPSRRAIATGVAMAVAAGVLSTLGILSAHADVSTSAWYNLVNDNSGKCVDAQSASTANGTAVQQYACNGTTAQQWQLRTAADAGYYVVVNQNGAQPAVDVNGPSTASGALIHLWSDGGWSSQEWQPVPESGGSYHFVNHYSGLCLDVPAASTADSVQLQQYACNGTAAQSFALNQVGSTPPPTTTTSNPGNPDLGPNVKIFDPSMSASSIQSTVNSIYNSQQSNQFGNNRYAMLFMPGSYNVDVPVGFYTQVAGLGASPDAVSLTGGGIHVDAGWSGGNATQNFWRDVENLSDTPSSGTLEYAVSQADPFRRVDVHGNMILDDNTSGNTSSNWSSGGYIGDSRISGQINSGTQQQFLTQDTAMGSWAGSNWNMVFVGDTGAPGQSFPTYTNVAQSPTMREKPYLYVDSTGLYNVMVPAVRTNASGPDWTERHHAGHVHSDLAVLRGQVGRHGVDDQRGAGPGPEPPGHAGRLPPVGATEHHPAGHRRARPRPGHAHAGQRRQRDHDGRRQRHRHRGPADQRRYHEQPDAGADRSGRLVGRPRE